MDGVMRGGDNRRCLEIFAILNFHSLLLTMIYRMLEYILWKLFLIGAP